MAVLTVFAPATIGNVGPGFDHLGLCIGGLGDELSGELAPRFEIAKITGRQAEMIPLEAEKNAATIAAQAYFRLVGYDGGLRMKIHRSLPMSGGLGASASSAVGGAMLAAALLGNDPKDPRVVEAALTGEAAVAGCHLDNIAPCLFGGLVLCQSLEPIRLVKVPTQAPWWVAVLTPNACLKTKEAREVLPKVLPTAAWVAQSANTAALVLAFMQGDAELLKQSFHDGFAEPARAPLIPSFFAVKEAAMARGALGCTISGGGPSIFALGQNQSLAEAIGQGMLAAAGAGASLHIGAICHKGARFL